MSNNPTRQDKNSSFDLHEFIESCKSHWKWYAVAVAFAVVLGCYMYLKSYTTYDVSAKILMYDDSANAGGMSLVKQFSIGGLIGGSGAVDDEIKVLQSHSLMYQTAKQLKLNVDYSVKTGLLREEPVYGDKVPVIMQCDKQIVDTLTAGIGFKLDVSAQGKADIVAKVLKDEIGSIKNTTLPATVETTYGSFTFVPTPAYVAGEPLKESVSLGSYDAAAESCLKNVVVTIPDKKSSMIELSVTTVDPEFGKILLDTIIANYNQRGIEERRQRDLKTARLIDQRLAALTQDLEQSEASVENFQESKLMIDIGSQAQSVAGKILELKNAIEVAKTEVDLIDMTRKFLSDSENKYALIPMESSMPSAYNSMITSYNERILRRMQLTNGAKSNNATLRNLDEQLDAFRANILLTLGKAYETALFRYDELKATQREYESMLGAMPSQMRDYRGIRRDLGVKEQLYLFLLQQREETAMTIENGQPRAVIVDNAYTLEFPHKFGKMKLLMLVFFIGFVIPTALVFVVERMRPTISSRSRLDRLTSVPVLGEVELPGREALMIDGSATQAAALECFRTLRNNLRFILPDKDEKVILVTSAAADEDAPYVAVNLAGVLALLGRKVVLVDMDVRRPDLDRMLGLEGRQGLVDYLADGKMSRADVTSRVEGVAAFDVVTAGNLSVNSSELLSGSRLDSLVASLRDEYDYVVILSSPFAEVADSYSIAHVADATIVTIKSDKTEQREFDKINEAEANERFAKMSVVRVSAPAGKKGKKVYGSAD